MSLGWEGYGLYWALIEKLRESKDYKLSLDFNLIAFDLRTDNKKIKSIVTGFGLFTIDEKNKKFYSKSLLNRMEIKDSKSDKARQAANARWEKERNKNANGMQTHSESNANGMQVKESKGKENNIKDVFAGFVDEISKAEHAIFRETFYLNYKLRKGSLSKILELFNNHLILQEKPYQKIQDYKKHFLNWMNVQEAQNKLGDYKIKRNKSL